MAKLNLENFLPYRLNRIASLVSKEFRTVYGPDYDLTIPEWRVLATLGQFDQMSAREIGIHSSMHKTKVSRAVRGLEERRWLHRETSEQDRREELLTLTSAGRRYYDNIVPRAAAFEGKLLEAIGDDAEKLLLLLSRLEGSFGKSADDDYAAL